MNQITRQQVLAQMRWRCAHAGRIYKAPLPDQALEWFGDHRKAAIRALRAHPAAVSTVRPATCPFLNAIFVEWMTRDVMPLFPAFDNFCQTMRHDAAVIRRCLLGRRVAGR